MMISRISRFLGHFLFGLMDRIPDRAGQPVLMFIFVMATLAILPHILISDQKKKWRKLIVSRRHMRRR